MTWLQPISSGVGTLGVLVIAMGVAGGLVRFIRSELALMRGLDARPARHRLRQSLGYHLLLGLEFLIAADIIDTLMKPEPRELITLGAIVAIRTVISFSLNAELRHETHADSARAA